MRIERDDCTTYINDVGALVVSAMVSGYRTARQYIDYTEDEAIELFISDIEQEATA